LGGWGLVVETLQAAWRPGHEQGDDRLRGAGEVRLLRGDRVGPRGRRAGRLAEEGGQRDRPEADAAVAEEPAAGEVPVMLGGDTIVNVHDGIPGARTHFGSRKKMVIQSNSSPGRRAVAPRTALAGQ